MKFIATQTYVKKKIDMHSHLIHFVLSLMKCLITDDSCGESEVPTSHQRLQAYVIVKHSAHTISGAAGYHFVV